MNRLAFGLALALVLSGCSLVPGGGDPTETVTPVPVPESDAGPVGAPTAATPSQCVAPAASSVDPVTVTPASRVPVPVSDGTVDWGALLAAHEAALSSVSYRLRTDSYELRTVPNRSAFVYEARLPPVSHIWYAVAGTLYLHVELESGTAYVRRGSYDPRDADDGSLGSLVRTDVAMLTPPNAAYSEPEGSHGTFTGRERVERAVGDAAYAVARTTTWRGERVRVLRPAGSNATRDGGPTVYVDRRGIVRYVGPTPASDGDADAGATLRITGVGSTQIRRPAVFCGTDIEGVAALRTPSPSASVAPTVSVSPTPSPSAAPTTSTSADPPQTHTGGVGSNRSG